MSQTTVEEIMTAVRRLPSQDRRRLSELLEREADVRLDEAHAPSPEPAHSRGLDQIPASREQEMQWLLDHQDFWDQHRGEHVALWGYEMIAVGKTRKEVVGVARQRGIKFPFVQYLPVHEHEWYLGMSNQPAIEP
ncbi:MAG: hypothetical protein AAB354_06930 [candidate division KSB1 bacterium]